MFSYLTLSELVFQDYEKAYEGKINYIGYIFGPLDYKKIFQEILGTQNLATIGFKTSLGPTMAPKRDLKISDPLSGCVYHFYIIHSLVPLTIC